MRKPDDDSITFLQLGLSTALTFAAEILGGSDPDKLLASLDDAGLPSTVVKNTKLQLQMLAQQLRSATKAPRPIEITAAQRVAAASQHSGIGQPYFTHG